MNEPIDSLEDLIERITEYGKTSYELAKLKAVDKTSDVVSSFIPPAVVFIIVAAIILFLSLGVALWLGEIIGKVYFGFFVVAAFYAITGIAFYLLMYKRLKRSVGNNIIKQMLK